MSFFRDILERPIAYLAMGAAMMSLGAGFGLAFCSTGCTPGLSGTQRALVEAERAQELNCVYQYAPDASAQNGCRAFIKAQWDVYWAKQFDGGSQ